MLATLKQRFLSTSSLARTAYILLAALILAIALAAAWRVLAPNYQVLFSNLDAQDASAIVGELERMKVAHRLQDEGRTILVDRDDVYRTRLKLMSKGVNLHGTVGFELFNEADFGMTEFAQKINYQRAMQGELARTIMGLEEVQSARVHLVIPESGLLRRGDDRGKASITIAVRPGKQLHATQVQGIQRLVAAAVPQIEPGAVTVVDSRGVTLSARNEKSGEGENGGEAGLDLKRQTESYFVSKAATVLDKAVGPGRAIVMVDVILNQDALKVTEEKVLVAPGGSGDGAVLRSKQTSLADTRPRPASSQSTENAGGAANRESSVSEVEFQHGRRIEQMVSAPGAIRRISVGVVLPEPLPAPQLQRLTEVVSMAVGLNPARGDGIAVYNLETLVSSQRETAPAAATMSTPNRAATPAPAPTTRDHESADLHSGGEAVLAEPWLAISVLLLLVLLGALLVWRAGSTNGGPARLSEAERARMLQEMKEWLAPRAPRGMR